MYTKGAVIEVKPRTTYQHLSQGAVIDPPIPHDRAGFKTTIRDVYQDVMEDEAGREVIQITIECANGELVDPADVTLL